MEALFRATQSIYEGSLPARYKVSAGQFKNTPVSFSKSFL